MQRTKGYLIQKQTDKINYTRVAIVSEKNKHLADNKKVYCFPLWCIQLDCPEATEDTCLIVDMKDVDAIIEFDRKYNERKLSTM
jgi:hypothetical protein